MTETNMILARDRSSEVSGIVFEHSLLASKNMSKFEEKLTFYIYFLTILENFNFHDSAV